MKVIPPATFGTGSFSRASSGTYYNASGYLATATTNELRVGYDRVALTCTGAVIENASTNILLYCRDLTQAAWVATNMTVAKDQTGVDNSATSASSILATATDATVLQTNTLASSARMFSANIKRLVGTGTVSMTTDNGATWTPVTVTTSWTRVSVPLQTVTNPVSGFKIAVSGDKIAVDYCQNETSRLTSEIATTTVAVTRAADVVGTGMYSTVAEPYNGATAWNQVTAYTAGDYASYLYRTYVRLVTGTTATAPDEDIVNWLDVGPHEIEYTNATYAVGDVRIVSTEHRKYMCLTAGAKTVSPELDLEGWLDIGPTNKWAMFDVLRNTGTTGIGSTMTALIKPGTRIDSIATLSTDATYVFISVIQDGVTIFTHTGVPPRRDVASWYEFFFSPLETFGDYVDFDLPPVSSAVIAITFVNAAASISCGACVIGLHTDIGKIQWSSVSDTMNFSSVTRDDYGNSTMVPRRNVPKTNQEVFVENRYINRVRRLRDELNARPAVWSGLDDDKSNDNYEALLILGFYRIFTITMETPIHSKINLELEEV